MSASSEVVCWIREFAIACADCDGDAVGECCECDQPVCPDCFEARHRTMESEAHE